MALHVALSMRLDAIKAHELEKNYRAEVLHQGADAVEALPQDYECDPGRGDAVLLLRQMAKTDPPNLAPLTEARAATRTLLMTSTGAERPEWRAVFSTDGTDEPTGIAPVCTDPEHLADDEAEAYDCCPDPVIECESPVIATYLVELLNADRGAA
ncbi:hypothetical protein [Streptomyces sp. BE230]|uniref:hypothetical protein n=1 Tax=Streptomyces sp. BE230 TaxID=3002526 RepID=UPI002ED2E103|nr:hypothetical protein [Streptomyces sp. BE230]